MRAVRFSKMAEVRHMSENDATEALLARLGYQASIRAGEHARRQAHKFSIQQIAKFALVFGFLVSKIQLPITILILFYITK